MTALFRNIQVIINPASGNDEPMLNVINDVFGQYELSWDARITHGPGEAADLTRAAADDGCDLVVSYGGDGTLMEVVNGLMGTGLPLGILPGGTGNAVAAELGIPTNLADAVRVIATSATRRRLDVGEVDGRYFLLRAYTGFPEDYTATREMKDRFGSLAYPLSALRFLKEYPPARFRIEVDDQVFEETGLMCYVNNVAYARTPRLQDWVERAFLDVQAHVDGEVVSLAEPALHAIDPSDGLLDVVLLTQDPFTLGALKSILVRSGEAQATVHLLQGKRIRISADPPQPLWIDGENHGETPATIQAVPGAVEVIVPNPGPTA